MFRFLLIVLLLTFATHQTAEAIYFASPKFLTDFFKKDEPNPPTRLAHKSSQSSKQRCCSENSRQVLIDAMIKAKIPGFIKTTPNGDMPVVLVNSNTYKKLSPHMKNSVGILIALQPDHTNDHGLLRVSENIIDVDSPGKRGFGEINKTGLTWKNVASYLKRRHENSYVLVEVVYKVTDEELLAMDYYQRVRRAAIIRVPFTYDDVPPEKGLNNLLRSGEHCFVFSKCSAVDSHISEMKQKIETLSNLSTDKVMKDPVVQAFLKDTREKILVHPANELSPFLYTEDAVAIKNIFLRNLMSKTPMRLLIGLSV